jgi:hypothetical protein
MDRELLTALLGPLVTGFLAALGVWLKDWRQRRDDEQRRRRTLSHAREQVGFIQAWVEAHQRVAPASAHEQARTQAQLDLEQAYAAVARSLAVPMEEREPITLGKLVGSLLLLRRLRTKWAKAARVIYYFGLAWAGLWAAVGADQTVEQDFTPTGVLVAIVMILVFGVAPAWGLHTWVLWLGERRVTRSSERSGHAVSAQMSAGEHGSTWYQAGNR